MSTRNQDACNDRAENMDSPEDPRNSSVRKNGQTHAKDKSGARVITEGKTALGFMLGERARMEGIGNRNRTGGITAEKPTKQE